jgi:hypothetical protein
MTLLQEDKCGDQWQYAFKDKGGPDMFGGRVSRIAATGIVSALLGVVLMTAVGLTPVMASRALPGELPHSLKTGIEGTGSGDTGDAVGGTNLALLVAARQMIAIERLVAEGDLGSLAEMVNEYQHSIRDALAELKALAARQPASAQALGGQITASLTECARTLSGVPGMLPAAGRTAALGDIEYSQAASALPAEFKMNGTVEQIAVDRWLVSGHTFYTTPDSKILGIIAVGDRVSVRAWAGSDGRFELRQVRLTSDDHATPPAGVPVVRPTPRTDDCLDDCDDDCTGDCIGGCTDDCSDGCLDGCADDCTGDCVGGCTDDCDDGCLDDCDDVDDDGDDDVDDDSDDEDDDEEGH